MKSNNYTKMYIRSNNKSKTNLSEKPRNSAIRWVKKRNFDFIKEKIMEKLEIREETNNSDKNIISHSKSKSMANALALKKLILNKASMNKEYILYILEKNPKNRKENEIKDVSEFLSKNYSYFQNLKKNESQLIVEKLAKVSRIKVFYPGETIIKFGDIGEKFYVVIEGFVQVYKPIFEEKKISPNDFIKYMKDIKFREKDENKYLRIKNYNKKRNFDIDEYEKIYPDMNFMKKKEIYSWKNYKAWVFMEKGFLLGKYH